MGALRRPAWILALGLLGLSVACKTELDDKPAADPLDDPWVDGIDSSEAPTGAAPLAEPDEALAAGPAADPDAGPDAEPAADPNAEPDALALAEASVAGAPEPATGVIAAPTPGSGSAGATKVASLAPAPLAAEPADNSKPAPAPEPEPAPTADSPATPAAPAVAPAPAEPPKPAAPPALTIADFHGNYRFSGGSAQRKDLEQAIEDASMQLAAVIRGIGRKRLTKTNPIDNTLDIVIAGDKLTTVFETGFDAACVIDGPTVHYTNKGGDKYKVRVRKKGDKLIQIIEGDDGVKTTVFVLSADRQRLTVHHKIVADRLPEPMAYRLSYSRK